LEVLTPRGAMGRKRSKPDSLRMVRQREVIQNGEMQ